jgi:hypothetical protein
MIMQLTTSLSDDGATSEILFIFWKWEHDFKILCTRVLVPTTVTARSKAWTAFPCWNIGIMGSNPTWGMDVCVCLFCVCAILRAGSGFATGWSPVQGVLPTV